MNFKSSMQNLTTDLAEIRAKLGDDGANKVYAIVSILEIGKTSVAYSKAILAAAEMAFERMTVMETVADSAKTDA